MHCDILITAYKSQEYEKLITDYKSQEYDKLITAYKSQEQVVASNQLFGITLVHNKKHPSSIMGLI